jgi:hypothetical protein
MSQSFSAAAVIAADFDPGASLFGKLASRVVLDPGLATRTTTGYRIRGIAGASGGAGTRSAVSR